MVDFKVHFGDHKSIEVQDASSSDMVGDLVNRAIKKFFSHSNITDVEEDF